MEELKPVLTMDECIEKIEEYLGDLSEGTPPAPPDLETCQAINNIIKEYNVVKDYFKPPDWLNCGCREAVGDGTVQCKDCGRYI